MKHTDYYPTTKVKQEKRVYGPYGRFARWVFRLFSRRYSCTLPETEGPVVYVCRHLDMHGPYTTLKWLPCQPHAMILNVFFQRETTVRHMKEYTLSARYHRKPRRFSLIARVLSWIAPPLMRSLQAVPVYRDGTNTIKTMKQGLKYLLEGENLIVYPDVHYMNGYEQPSDIYDGFLFLGELYYKKTGKALSFVPLMIDDEQHRILANDAITLTDYRRERGFAAAYLKTAINK